MVFLVSPVNSIIPFVRLCLKTYLSFPQCMAERHISNYNVLLIYDNMLHSLCVNALCERLLSIHLCCEGGWSCGARPNQMARQSAAQAELQKVLVVEQA
jgi:hypothetical protein